MKPVLIVKKHPVSIMAIYCAIFLTVGLIQDYAHSITNNNNFYASESMLYNTFWLWFLPLFYVLYQFTNRRVNALKLYQIAFFWSLLIFCHLLLFSIFVHLFSWVFFYHAYEVKSVFSYAIANKLITCVLFYGLSAIIIKYGLGQDSHEEVMNEMKTITVKSGQNSRAIKIHEIVYIKSESPYVALITMEAKYLYSSSLKEIGQQLGNSFIRIHKSTIINTDHMVTFKSRQNGDYDISMSNGDNVRVSRNFATSFKERFC